MFNANSNVATLRLRLFDSPREELRPLVEGPPPRWALRIFETHGGGEAERPAAAVVEALAEMLTHRLRGITLVLRKAESRGWLVTLDGDVVRITSGLSISATRDLLVQDGVWDLVCKFSPDAAPGEVVGP